MAKRVVRKSASKPSRPEKSLSGRRRHPDALENPEAIDEAIANPPKKPVKAERVAKVVNLIVSVGDDDRGRTFEEFLDFIRDSLGVVPGPTALWSCADCGRDVKGDAKECPKCKSKRFNVERNKGPHVALTGGYYIVDGKVCLPDDYDPKRENFKTGSHPPVWAGGPKTAAAPKIGAAQKQMDWDLENLSSDEYDRKYQLGKYAPKSESAAEHDARMRRERAAKAAAAAAREEEELEEFEWDEDDVNDDEKLGKVADESASAAVKKMKSKPKRVVRTVAQHKEQTKTAKRVVRKVKK